MGSGVRRMLAVGVVVLAAAGCGSGSETIEAAGVDELVIPTPSPDPDDFVETIDNPWLPLAPGATWTYESETEPTTRLTVTVADGPEIAGVPTTAVRNEATSLSMVDYFAQDIDGNVWWFGREGEWVAGEDGVEAGIAMLARPRVGDGYAEMGTDGEPGQRSVIEELGDELVIETETTNGDVLENHYERGTGPVLRELEPGIALGLVAYDEPQS